MAAIFVCAGVCRAQSETQAAQQALPGRPIASSTQNAPIARFAPSSTVSSSNANPPGANTGDTNFPDKPTAQNTPYEPITPGERFRWVVRSTLGPQSLAAGVFTAGFGTAIDAPHEYGPHWDGFADRYGMRFTGIATQNTMEAGLGVLWGEDPRYFRATSHGFKARLGHAAKMTVLAERADGSTAPAYARFIAIPGSNFIANSWRADSEADASHALLRTCEGFGGRFAGNVFQEFLPDIVQHVLHHPVPR